MMAVPSPASNQKCRSHLDKSGKTRIKIGALCLFAAITLRAAIPPNEEEPNNDKDHEREELGVNRYTTPSIEKIFAQLDQLGTIPFDQLKREPPKSTAPNREQKGLIFGGLIADGFLIVEAERRNAVETLGRTLLEYARALGVGDQVMRHSASLTELGKRGDWMQMRHELLTTQTDVEQTMVDLRDEKMAHLISLGGWLRGLEISAAAIEAGFSPQRAKVLAQPDLADYFEAELKTLPPLLMHAPLIDKLRVGIKNLRSIINKAPNQLTQADAAAIHREARELNDAIRQTE